MLLSSSHANSTDNDETKGPFWGPHSVRTETWWKGVACVFGDVSADLKKVAHAATSSVESACKVRSSWRWLGPRSIDCKSHFHVTLMKRTPVKPLFKGWGIWDKWKIKMQTSLPFFSTLKAAFLIDQSTAQFSVSVHLGQMHSCWTRCHWNSFTVHFRQSCLHCPQQVGLEEVCCSQEGRQAYF